MIDDHNEQDIHELLAANLRRLRIARQLSLSELARATGMSKATLSGIESGRSNPTLGTLAALATALRVSMVELVGELPLGEVRVVRATNEAFTPRDGLPQRPVDQLAADVSQELAEICLEPLQVVEVGPGRHGARGCLYVVEGTVVAGPVERSTELAAGDYIAFPADVPHIYAAGRRRARALLLTQVPR